MKLIYKYKYLYNSEKLTTTVQVTQVNIIPLKRSSQALTAIGQHYVARLRQKKKVENFDCGNYTRSAIATGEMHPEPFLKRSAKK